MKKIIICGVDGSGKSTVIYGLRDILKDKGLRIKTTHLRLKLNNNKSVNISYGRPDYKKPRSTLFTLVKLIYFSIEEGLAVIKNRNLDFIIYDRYITDIFIDPSRYRIRLNKLISFAIKKLFSKPEIIIYLYGDFKKISIRKNELSVDEMKKFHKKYIIFFSDKSPLIINTTENSISKTLKLIKLHFENS